VHSIYAKLAALFGVLSLSATPGCTETQECARQAFGLEGCAEQVCVSADPPLTLTDQFSSYAVLSCMGCEQEAPAYFELLAFSPQQPTQDGVMLGQQIELRLAPSWDRSFSAASLNAALVTGESRIQVSGPQTATDGTLLQWTIYSVRPGGVVNAEHHDGRVALELRASLDVAAAPATQSCLKGSCNCKWDRRDASDAPRTFTLDLPYVIPPNRPRPAVTVEPAVASICAGDCVELRAVAQDGVAPYTYYWDDEAPSSEGLRRVCPAATTTYAVVAQDARIPSPHFVEPNNGSANATVIVRKDCVQRVPDAPSAAECHVRIPAQSVSDARLATDAVGNMFLAGDLYGRVDFGEAVLTSGSRRDLELFDEKSMHGFLVKYDSRCRYVWSRGLGSATQWAYVTAIATDAQGNLIVLGQFSGTRDPLRSTPLPAAERPVDGMFLAKLTTDGDTLFTRLFDAPRIFNVYDVTVDAGGAIIVTVHIDPVTASPGAVGNLMLQRDGVHVLKFDSQGTLIFARSLHGASRTTVATDAAGSIYAVSYGSDPISVEGGPAIARAESGTYVLGLSAEGDVRYQIGVPKVAWVSSQFSGVDAAGNLLLIGTAMSVADQTWSLVEQRFSPTGALLWTRSGPWLEEGDCYAWPSGLAVQRDGSYLTTNYDCVGAEPKTPGMLVKKWGPDGQLLWERRVGTDPVGRSLGVAIAGTGQPVVLRKIPVDPNIGEGVDGTLVLSKLEAASASDLGSP
jgi:hypothetical protein